MSKWPGPPEWEPFFKEITPDIWVEKEPRKPILLPKQSEPDLIENSKEFRFVMEILMPLVLVPIGILAWILLLHAAFD